MEKKEMIVPDELVISKIYYIREQKVMLDRDLAELYGVQPIRLREQVKRNIERFLDKFMFQLAENEVDGMVSQIAIPSKQSLGGHLPYVFTEHGVLMLANTYDVQTVLDYIKQFLVPVEQVERRMIGFQRGDEQGRPIPS